MEILNITVLRRAALDWRYITKVLSWELWGDCARSHLKCFKTERDYLFSKLLNVIHILHVFLKTITLVGTMKMHWSLWESLCWFKIRPSIRMLCSVMEETFPSPSKMPVMMGLLLWDSVLKWMELMWCCIISPHFIKSPCSISVSWHWFLRGIRRIKLLMHCMWMASGFHFQGVISTEFCLMCRCTPERRRISVFCDDIVADETSTSGGVKGSWSVWEPSQNPRQH